MTYAANCRRGIPGHGILSDLPRANCAEMRKSYAFSLFICENLRNLRPHLFGLDRHIQAISGDVQWIRQSTANGDLIQFSSH